MFSGYKYYFDSAAQTPLLPKATDVLMSYYAKGKKGVYFHPDSPHSQGVATRNEIQRFKNMTAQCLQISPSSLLFFPSTTYAHMHVCDRHRKNTSDRIIFSSHEHSKIVDYLKRKGGTCKLFFIKDDVSGLDLFHLSSLLTPKTLLVSVVAVQSETGIKHPIKEIYTLIQEYNKKNNAHILFHTDATQYAPVYSLESIKNMCDFFTFKASKVYGPEGIAALCISPHVSEEVKRGILERYQAFCPLPLVASFGTALCDTQKNVSSFYSHTAMLKTLFLSCMSDTDAKICGKDMLISEYCKKEFIDIEKQYAPHIVCVDFPNVQSEYLVSLLDAQGFSVSAKSACQTYMEKESLGLRISFSRYNTKMSVKKLARVLKKSLSLAGRLIY